MSETRPTFGVVSLLVAIFLFVMMIYHCRKRRRAASATSEVSTNNRACLGDRASCCVCQRPSLGAVFFTATPAARQASRPDVSNESEVPPSYESVCVRIEMPRAAVDGASNDGEEVHLKECDSLIPRQDPEKMNNQK